MNRWIFALIVCLTLIMPARADAAGEVGVTYGDQHGTHHKMGYHYPAPNGAFSNMHGNVCFWMGFQHTLVTGVVHVGGNYQIWTVDDPQDYPNDPARTLTVQRGTYFYSAGTYYPIEVTGQGSPWRHFSTFPANWENMVTAVGSKKVPIDHYFFVKKVSTGEIIVNGRWEQYSVQTDC